MSWMIPMLLLEAICLTVILNRLCNNTLERNFEDSVSTKQCRYAFGLTFLFTFGILSMYYYAFFPGGFFGDCNTQLYQAVAGGYTDWHPFMHTFLFFMLPMRIFGAEEMIVFLQLLYFSLSFAYLVMTIRKYGCPKWLCVFGGAGVVLAPVTGNIMMYPLKDCGLAIFATVATAHYIHIVMTKAQWLEKKRNVLACSIFWALTTLVRHNAVLFVAPIVLITLKIGWTKRKQVISAVALFLGLLLLIKGPFYHAYHVAKPGYRVVETTGMCMTIMGNVVKNCPDALDREVLDFLYNVSSPNAWEEGYETGSFNSIKHRYGINYELMEEEGFWNILRYTLKAFKASEMYSLQAFLRLTGMVWKLDGDMTWEMQASADTSKTEIILDATRQARVSELLNSWYVLVDKSIWKYPMNYIGWFHLAIIAFSLSAIRKRHDFWKFIIGMPLLCYNFGTALLLSGGGTDWRFFYMSFPTAIPIIFLVIRAVQRGEDL